MRKSKAEIKEIRSVKEQQYLELNRAYAETFGSDQGKRVLNDILSKGHFYSTTFTGDTKGMFLEGKRDLALYVMKRTNTADSNIMVDIMAENQLLQLNNAK